MILKNSKQAKILENLLKNEKISVDHISVNNGRFIKIEFYGSSGQKIELEKNLKKINLKLQRSEEYYSSSIQNKEQKYEIYATDGEGNDIISTYCYNNLNNTESLFKK